MAKLALLISVIALVIAILAYREVGGTRHLQESVQALQGALDAARKETADTLSRLERAVRSPSPEGTPAKPPAAPTRP
jgi:hypothetical protein